MGMKKGSDEGKIGIGKLLLWQSRMVSTTVAFLTMTFLMLYCTDTLKIPAAAVSGILVGSKIIDGFTDMFAGFIVDRTKTKWGKARPYEVFIVLMWLFTWLLFSCPEFLSTALKCVWIFVMYVLVNCICYTFLNANNTPYIVRAFKDNQIVKLTSFGSVITMLAGLIFNILFPVAMSKVAINASGWSRLILMMAIPLAAIGILRMLFIEEKYDVDSVAPNKNQISIKDSLNVFKTNKYIILMAGVNLIFNFVSGMGITPYYYKYIVGNTGLMGLASAAQILAIPLAFIFPSLIKRFSTAKLMVVGYFVSATGFLLNYFAYDNVPLLMIAAILTGGGAIPSTMLIGLIVIDCADYNEWRGLHRMEGTMSSIVGLGQKIGTALGAGALGVFLQASGFTGEASTMPSTAYTMIRLLMSFIPMGLYILTGLSMTAYKLDKIMPQIKSEIEEKRREATVSN